MTDEQRRTKPHSSDHYDREVVRALVREVARDRLSGTFTTETVEWEDGDFRVEAFHTIDATYPFEAEANDEEQGLPFYRERIRFSTTDDEAGYVFQEVVRRTCGETGCRVVHSRPVAWAGVEDPRTSDAADALSSPLDMNELRFPAGMVGDLRVEAGLPREPEGGW